MTSRFSLRDLSLLLALFAIGAFFTWKTDHFLTPSTLTQLVVEVSIAATLAVGMLLVILPGHIDLSAGSGVGLIGGLAAVLITGSGWLCDALRSFHLWLAAQFGPGVAAWFPPPPWPDPIVMLLCVLIAMLLWWLMGALIVRERIQAFIITLGGMLIFRGLFWKIIESHTISVNGPTLGKSWPVEVAGQAFEVPQDWLHRLTTEYFSARVGLIAAGVIAFLMLIGRLRDLARRRRLGIEGDDFELTFVKWLIAAQILFLFVIVSNQLYGVPLPAVIFGFIAWFVHVLTRHTRFGRYLYAIGGNEEAAVVSGINVRRVSVGAFVILGVIVAIVGFMQAAYVGYSTTVGGEGMELNAVAACVIGGVSLKGGRGTVFGVFLGALIMATLEKGMSQMGLLSEDKFIVRGAVLILAVWTDTRLSRKVA
jgi:D-xylose transport system permease protein